MFEEAFDERRNDRDPSPNAGGINPSLAAEAFQPRAATLAASREWLKQSFLDLCRGAGLVGYVPSAITDENRQDLLPGESAYQCKRFVADFCGLIGTFSATESHGQFHAALEATGRAQSGKLMCLVDAYEGERGHFVLPMNREFLRAVDQERLEYFKMPGSCEELAEGAGIVGIFESRRWQHATLAPIMHPQAFEQALGSLCAVAREIEIATGSGTTFTSEVSVNSLLARIMIWEAEKSFSLQASSEAAFEDLLPAEAQSHILGVASLCPPDEEGNCSVSLAILETPKAGSGNGLILSAAPLLHTEHMRLRRDQHGIVRIESTGSSRGRLTF